MGGDRVHKPFGPDPEKQTRYEAFLWLKEREKMQGSKEGAGAASERERVDGRFGVSKKEEGGGEESGSRTKVKKEEEEAKGASGVRKRDRDIEREREAAEREREEGESSKDAKGQNDEDQTNRRIMTDHERRVGKAAAEREKLEFERVYRMFRSGAALVKAGDTNGALERDTGGAGGKRGVSGTSASTERKATRTVHHWAPDPLVCVRFGLPNPSLTEESHERKRGPQGGRGGIGPTSGLGASSSLQGSPLPATTPTAPIVIEDETDARSAWVDRSRQGAVGVAGSSRGTGGGTAALSEAFELEGGGKREDPAPPPSISRPAESLFKEIFGDENDEDE
uniref:Uncharacterized protein n=1 Tax=Chromera velia CCMP2878 TaxID=1169474 RepID=A0A0G4GKZ4_9ALVE|eukprot:Cvel_22373.t1-p1 / transcript=Cvel_22373.t1 / gene=Cvel_22373 / organism=Chromera_velia_CCMP2878 / gene_product=hypothetical protein / transcript_product=hypothetical protein / location=Cvel_scaffold2192:17058-20215(+) / protein_length=337 / sequence_SO=supercontig / SO=protein_coding / is_pseudo=false